MHIGTSRAWAVAALLAGAVPAAAQQPQAGGIDGLVVSEETGEPVPSATVRLLETQQGELSHDDGTFHFERLPAGEYTVAVQRLGYAPAQRGVRVAAGETTEVRVVLTPSAITIPGVVITGTGRTRDAAEAYRPTSVLDDAELRRRLATSIAATLASQPGISQRYNGPAASQPVIRGLGGDRVLVLEDGGRTGDLAAGSADHAVAIEPLTAERIEVLRGPAGLLYGSNALGGVINVIREEIPRTVPEALTGRFSAQAESVNRGVTAGGELLAGAGPVAARLELSGRTAGDTRTPRGDLPSTGLDGYNAAAGASWVHDRGYAGASLRDYTLEYGVPGTFGGATIPGAHEGGVSIDMRRTSLSAGAGLHSGVGPFSGIEWEGRYVRYEHAEREPGGQVGTSFGQLTATSRLVASHRHAEDDLRAEGAGGLWVLWQDLAATGTSALEPARELGLAGFLFEELAYGRARLQFGGRYDWIRVTPEAPGRASIGEVRERTFGALSGSVAGLFEPVEGVILGASVSRAFRTPSITELYSTGPHLADYSFNVGNPDLEAEHGTGIDLFARLDYPRLSGEVAVYRNRIDGYIHYAPTGELDPRLGRFPVYRATSDDALLNGAEGRLQWEALPGLALDATATYVRGTRRGDDSPLPAIPPLQGALGARYESGRWFLSLGWEGAARQGRVGEFERPTPGHDLWRAGAGLRWTGGGDLHTLALQLSNLTDRVWFDHLSRMKEVAPQPGRNVEILYRVSF